MKRLLVIPALALVLGLGGLSMQPSSVHAQGLMPAPAVAQMGGGLCVNGSVPTSLGCSSAFAPNYPFGNSFYNSALFGSSFYGSSFGWPYSAYAAPSSGFSSAWTPGWGTGMNSEFANVACLAGFIGYPCGPASTGS